MSIGGKLIFQKPAYRGLADEPGPGHRVNICPRLDIIFTLVLLAVSRKLISVTRITYKSKRGSDGEIQLVYCLAKVSQWKFLASRQICKYLLNFIKIHFCHSRRGRAETLDNNFANLLLQCGPAGMHGIFVLSGNNCKFHCSTHALRGPRPLTHTSTRTCTRNRTPRRRKTFALSNCRQIAELGENLCQNVCHRHSGKNFSSSDISMLRLFIWPQCMRLCKLHTL